MNSRRPNVVIFILALGLLLTTLASAQDDNAPAQDYSYARVVRLSLVDGDVLVLRPEAENWEEALLNLPMRQGYTLSSTRGRAEIEFESGATARLAENAALEFSELALSDGHRITRMMLQRGTATFYANLARNDVFAVTTPDLALQVTRNARFRVDVLASGTTVTILKGEVDASSSTDSYRLTKGQTLIFQEAAAEKVQIARNREQDEWDRWVADREDAINTASTNSQRYVNAPFRYGLADLSYHGRWSFDASYGNVWQPYGLGAGWSPYFHGRWVFVHGIGWTWVSFEPWGWVPYHYGRWVLSHRGWLWVPGGFHSWHPGLVAWVHFGDRVGWCPLGPRDRLGVAPHRPQGGVVIVNTPTGVIGGTRNDTTTLSPDARPRWVMQSPLTSRPRQFVMKDGRAETQDADARGRERATTGATVDQPAAGRPTVMRPPVKGETPGIVYDRDERRFVNDPRAPQPPATEETAGRPGTAVMGSPTTRPKPGGAPREIPVDRPSPRQGGDWSSEEPRGASAPGAPRPSTTTMGAPRSQPQPRTEPARPAPPPRTEAPRPAPSSPRMDSPRPAPSAPRSASPRPSPSGGASAGSAPRSSPSNSPRSPRPPRQ